MYKYSVFLVLCLLASAAAATPGQDDSTKPAVVHFQAKTLKSADESDAAAKDLAELERCLLKLKVAREALETERDLAKQQVPPDGNLEGPETTKLRLQLSELVNKLNSRNQPKNNADLPGPMLQPPLHPTDSGQKEDATHPKATGDKEPAKTSEHAVSETGVVADPRALAHVLFKAGNFELALKAYRMVSLTGMKADERAPLQYLMATCLRKAGKLDEAAALYREVANVRGDEQIAACAQWQLVQLRWHGDFDAQLKDLQTRLKALEANP